MNGVPDTVSEGPELVLVRNTKHEITMRAFRGRSPLRLIASNLGVRVVVSPEVGTDAEIALTLSPSINPEDDGTFVLTFEPHIFESIPLPIYRYAVFSVESEEGKTDILRPLTLPATLRVLESIGPSEVRPPEPLIGP